MNIEQGLQLLLEEYIQTRYSPMRVKNRRENIFLEVCHCPPTSVSTMGVRFISGMPDMSRQEFKVFLSREFIPADWEVSVRGELA